MYILIDVRFIGENYTFLCEGYAHIHLKVCLHVTFLQPATVIIKVQRCANGDGVNKAREW